MDVFLLFGMLLVSLTLLIWLGLQIKPRSFPPYPERPGVLETVPLPAGLPAPVERFYQAFYGNRIPAITSAVITGRADLRVFGLKFPARYRFTHQAGQDYRHYIEATFFGISIMKVNETYLDGNSRLELPFGVVENEPKVNQAANVGLWAESILLPAIFLTDRRVRWEALDETTARLVVPFGAQEDSFTVTFDPQTNLVTALEAMRYKQVTDEEKTLWRNEAWGLVMIEGTKVFSPGAVRWMDESKPWAVFAVEEIVYNVDVDAYVRGAGI